MSGTLGAKLSGVLAALALGLGWLAMSGVLVAQETGGSGCSSCHDKQQKLAKSAHASLTCETCHDNHEKYPHPKDAAKPDCGVCHDNQIQDYTRSVHGLA